MMFRHTIFLRDKFRSSISIAPDMVGDGFMRRDWDILKWSRSGGRGVGLVHGPEGRPA